MKRRTKIILAAYAGTEPEALTLLYRYEGAESRRCYRSEDLFLCVSRCGVDGRAASSCKTIRSRRMMRCCLYPGGFLKNS